MVPVDALGDPGSRRNVQHVFLPLLLAIVLGEGRVGGGGGFISIMLVHAVGDDCFIRLTAEVSCATDMFVSCMRCRRHPRWIACLIIFSRGEQIAVVAVVVVAVVAVVVVVVGHLHATSHAGVKRDTSHSCGTCMQRGFS